MEQKLREMLVEYGKKLVQSGLVQGTWGNISVRIDDTYMLTTPSGIDYIRLKADDMVKVQIDDMSYEGINKPTSEKELHAAIYKQRPDIGAIIHTHSKYSSVFAAANKDMPVLEEYADSLGNIVKLAEYALPGTKNLANNTVLALGIGVCAIMANHGMVACGEDMEKAFENCVKTEENGKKYLLTK